MRFLNNAALTVDWHFEYYQSSLYSYMPVQLFLDSTLNNEFYVLGMIDSLGGVMKLDRNTAKVNWLNYYNSLTQISSYVAITDTDTVVACGYSTTTSLSAVFKF